MSMSFDIGPQAARAFREVMCNDYIRPLSGPSHLHIYPGGYHMADNLKGGAKVYYDISPNGIEAIRLNVGGKSIRL